MWKIFCLCIIFINVGKRFGESQKPVGVQLSCNVSCVTRKYLKLQYKNGLEIPYNESLHKHDRFPSTLNIGIIDSPPFSKLNVSYKNKRVKLAEGYVPDLINILAQHINFTYKWIPMKDYGKQMNDGYWTGGVEGLIQKQIDIFAADLSMTPRRYMFIDFTTAFASDNYRIFLRKYQSETNLNWMVYWKPINWRCYIVLLAIVAIASLCLNASYCLIERKMSQRNNGQWSLPSVIFRVWGIVVSQGMTLESSVSSSRIFIVTTSIMAMLIYQCFNSVLISHMTVIEDMKVNSLQDILKQPNFKIGWQKSSIFQQEFKNSNLSHQRELWKRVQKFKTGNIKNAQELDLFFNANSAFVHAEYKFDSFSNGICNYHVFETINRDKYHFGLQKDSKLNEKLSITISKLRQSGILNRIHGNYKQINCRRKDMKGTKEPVGFKSAVGLFTPLLIGIPAAIIAFIFEMACWRRNIAGPH